VSTRSLDVAEPWPDLDDDADDDCDDDDHADDDDQGVHIYSSVRARLPIGPLGRCLRVHFAAPSPQTA
jgi:hypothetical protein